MGAEDGTSGPPGHPGETSPEHRRGDLFDPSCPTRRLLDRIGSRWTVMVVVQLHAVAPDELRFAELKRRVSGVSQKMLAQTLRSLERDSLVERRVEATSPPRVHYRLTALGSSLQPAIAALQDWAESYMAQVDEAGARWDRTQS